MRTRFIPASIALLVVVATLVGCRSLPPSKPASEWTPEEARGAEIYQAKCARCHYPTSTHALHGPGLQALTKIKSMPSGAPPTDERMTEVIVRGRQEMSATASTTANSATCWSICTRCDAAARRRKDQKRGATAAA